MRNEEKRGTVISLTLAVFLLGYGLLLLTGVTSIRHLLDNAIASYLLAWALYGMFARVPLSEVGKRFLLTTSALVGCWLLAESAALFRLIDYRALLGRFEQGNPLSIAGRRFDNELLWRHEAYYHYKTAYQGNLGQALCTPPDPARIIDVSYDKNGFRNNRDINEAELVVIGDSYIEGYLTSEAKLVTTILSDLQGKAVANLGHSGYGPQQELVVLKRFGLPLKPKTVIWAFFEGNDFLDADGYENRAHFSGNTFWQDFWFRSLTRNVAMAIFRHSPAACTPSDSIADLKAEFAYANNKTETVFFAPTEIEPPSESTLQQAAALIAKAAKLCQKQNIRFLVAFVPEKYRVYHDLPNVSLLTDAVRKWHVSSMPDQFKQVLTRLDPCIEYIDLTPALKSASQKGIATYLPDDTHWTDEGHRVAAETIHQALLHQSK